MPGTAMGKAGNGKRRRPRPPVRQWPSETAREATTESRRRARARLPLSAPDTIPPPDVIIEIEVDDPDGAVPAIDALGSAVRPIPRPEDPQRRSRLITTKTFCLVALTSVGLIAWWLLIVRG